MPRILVTRILVTRILVIGATGKIGREVIDQLSATQADVRALVRNAASVTAPGVEAVPGDLTIPETLDRALDGIDTVFLVWTAPPLTVAPVLDRIATRTRRIVFLSAPWKTPHPFFQKPQPNPGVNLLAEIERRIESSGLEWTFLRPAMFASNAFHWWGPQIRGGDIVRWPYLSAATAPVDARDIAAVAIRALCYDGHAGAEYVLTGPQSLTQREQISIIGSVIGFAARGRYVARRDTGRVASDVARTADGDAARRLVRRCRRGRVRHIHCCGRDGDPGAHVPAVGYGSRLAVSLLRTGRRKDTALPLTKMSPRRLHHFAPDPAWLAAMSCFGRPGRRKARVLTKYQIRYNLIVSWTPR
ncbi:MAG TPA: NAD(P)H-binding protein, partial [Bryobacteraceae bacterium]|nr:NAD(P)H-binding protein [Bryobacteraceae bacterium]